VEAAERGPREPTLLDAVLPVIVLVVLLALTLALFGVGATDGPLQVALFLSGGFAALMAAKNGHTFDAMRAAAVQGVSSAMEAIFILLAVGALIGTWNLSGTIPTVVSYGIEVLRPSIFFLAVAIVCALIGAITGSSWTTAGTLGVAFVGMAPILGVSETIAAGAVVSGAYCGDKMSFLSETTILVPSLVGGVTTNEHIRGMAWTVIPAFGASLVAFLVIGLNEDVSGSSAAAVEQARAAIESVFSINILNLLPLVLLIVVALRRLPAFLSILGVALFSGVLAAFTQPDVVRAFVDEPGQNYLRTSIEAIYAAMATGFVSTSGNEAIDSLFSRGGMASMLTTVWLILGALSFAAVMEQAGFLDRLIRPVVARARSATRLILTVAATAIGLNILAGDQYIAVVMPSRIFRVEFAERGLAPRMLSRTVEDTGTVTSPLVPWNSCGAYMSGVLGVPTLSYAPWALFNILNPLVAIGYAVTGFHVERLPDAAASDLAPK